MEIIQITTIKINEEERNALQTLKDAYRQCVSVSCFECNKCPLYVDDSCIGMYADTALENEKRG